MAYFFKWLNESQGMIVPARLFTGAKKGKNFGIGIRQVLPTKYGN